MTTGTAAPTSPVPESRWKLWTPATLYRALTTRAKKATAAQFKDIGKAVAEGAAEGAQKLVHTPDPLLTEVYACAAILQNLLFERAKPPKERIIHFSDIQAPAEKLHTLIQKLKKHEEILLQSKQSCFPESLSVEEKASILKKLEQSATLLKDIDAVDAARGDESIETWTGSQYSFFTSALKELEKHYNPGLVPELLDRIQRATTATLQNAQKTAATVIEHASDTATTLPGNMFRSALGRRAIRSNHPPQAARQIVPQDEGSVVLESESEDDSPSPINPIEASPTDEFSLALTQAALRTTNSLLNTARSVGFVGEDNETASMLHDHMGPMLAATDWEEMKNSFRQLTLQFQGDKVPNYEPNQLEDVGTQLSELARSVAPPPTPAPVPVEPQATARPIEELIREEKDLFVNNLTALVTMNNLQKWLGLKFDSAVSLTILKSGRVTDTGEETRVFVPERFERTLYDQIRGEGYWTRLKAIVLFPFLNKIVGYYTKKAVTIYFDKATAQLEAAKENQFQTLRATTLREATRFFTRLNAAYDAKEAVVTTDEDTRIKLALLEQESKLLQDRSGQKYDPSKKPNAVILERLYRPVISSVLRETLGKWQGILVGWMIKRLIGDPEKFVKDFVNTGLSSIRDPEGYSHAIGSLTLKQLTQMQEALASPKYAVGPRQTPLVSSSRTRELSQLVAQLVEVLDKEQCLTKAELEGSRGHIEFMTKLNKLAVSSVIETIALELAKTTNALLNEAELKKVMHQLFESTNNAFTNTPSSPAEDKHRIEKERALKIRRILNRILEDVIQMKLTGASEKGVETSLSTIKHLSQNFTCDIQDLLEIYSDASTKSGAKQILFERIKITLQKHLSQCQKALETAEAQEGLSEADKLRIKKHYAHAAVQARAMIATLNRAPPMTPFYVSCLDSLAPIDALLANYQTATLPTEKEKHLTEMREILGSLLNRETTEELRTFHTCLNTPEITQPALIQACQAWKNSLNVDLEAIRKQVEKPHFSETTAEKAQKVITSAVYKGAKGKADALFKLFTDPALLKLGPLYHTLHCLVLPPEETV